MCNKVALGIECLRCEYPSMESAFLDREPPFPCDTAKDVLREFLDSSGPHLVEPLLVEAEIKSRLGS